MTTISKAKLKAHMLRVFREIEESGEEIVVTDRGRPVLRIQPITRHRSAEDIFGPLRGQVVYHEDLDTPTGDEWPEA